MRSEIIIVRRCPRALAIVSEKSEKIQPEKRTQNCNLEIQPTTNKIIFKRKEDREL